MTRDEAFSRASVLIQKADEAWAEMDRLHKQYIDIDVKKTLTVEQYEDLERRHNRAGRVWNDAGRAFEDEASELLRVIVGG